MTSRSDEELAETKEKVEQLEKQLWELASQFRDHLDEGTTEAKEVHNDLDVLQETCDSLNARLTALEYRWGDGECAEEQWTLQGPDGSLDIDYENRLCMYESEEAAVRASETAGCHDRNLKPVKIQIIIVEDE